jgi:hypothetical protein
MLDPQTGKNRSPQVNPDRPISASEASLRSTVFKAVSDPFIPPVLDIFDNIPGILPGFLCPAPFCPNYVCRSYHMGIDQRMIQVRDDSERFPKPYKCLHRVVGLKSSLYSFIGYDCPSVLDLDRTVIRIHPLS